MQHLLLTLNLFSVALICSLFFSNSLLAQVSTCKSKILIIKGNPNAVADAEELADIINYSTNVGNHGWGEFADVLTAEGYIVEQIEEPFFCGKCDNAVNFSAINLADYNLIIFGSNNARYDDNSNIDLVESYIRSGGAALFVSDGAFGFAFHEAPSSDNRFLDRFGWTMNQDAFTYTIDATDFLDANHPILDNVSSFDGEGVSPISVNTYNVAGVESLILAGAEGQLRRHIPFQLGPIEAVTPNDAALVVASVDDGRIAGHYDRNTFFNLNGAGTSINRLSNKQFAMNLISWLTQCDEVPLIIPSMIEAEDYVHQSIIQVQNTADVGGGQNMGFIKNGDIAEYLVDVAQTCVYDLSLRVASATNGGTINLYFDGILKKTIQVNNTEGWQNWQTITSTIDLDAGVQSMVIEFTGDNNFLMNLNWIDFDFNANIFFQLIDANTDLVIRNLNDSDTIDLTVDGTDLNIIAVLSKPVGSVQFGYDANPSIIIENVAPYAVGGDMGGNYNSWTPTIGYHTLTANAFVNSGASGVLLDVESIGFYVIDSCPPFINDGSSPQITVDRFAANFISTNGIVPANNSIEMKASQYVQVTPTFEVITGSELLLDIEGCN